MEIIRTKNPKEEAGEELSKLLEHYKDKEILLLLSGGSAFSILENTNISFIDSNITIGMLDERYSEDKKINNFLQLQETVFFNEALKKNISVINSSIQNNESQEKLTDRLEKKLKEWVKENPFGIIITTMGIGEDGHVAGIITPQALPFVNKEDFLFYYSLPSSINQYTERISVTYTFLKKYVDETIVYAEGERKQKIIKKLEENNNESEIPAFTLKEMKSVKIFTSLL